MPSFTKKKTFTVKGLSKELSLEEFEQVIREMPGAVEAAIVNGLRATTLHMQRETVEQINVAKPYPAVDRGGLRSSVESEMVSDGGLVNVTAPHAPVIEHGARPFTPPLEPIKAWVLRKRIASDESEAMQIARAIQRKFRKSGIKPRRFFQKAYRIVRKQYLKMEIERALRELKR